MMFDVPLFMLISASAVVAIVLVVPGQVKGLLSRRSDITAPVPMVMVGAAVQQSLFAVGWRPQAQPWLPGPAWG
ncbi:MAG: hypothetical protein O7I42_11070, partial [Alphaproteobacteria bacterium]|nr:hypothetical protein [Alphaproteobacteria bacterium]